jgi:hypothetical protein
MTFSPAGVSTARCTRATLEHPIPFPLEAGAHNFDIIGSEVHDVQPLIETKTLVEIERTALSLSDLIPLVVIHYADDLEEVVFKDRVAGRPSAACGSTIRHCREFRYR